MPGSHKWEDSPQYKALGNNANLRKRQMAYAAWKATNFPKPKDHTATTVKKNYYGHKLR